MTDGRLLLGIATLIGIAVFFNGLRFSRMTENPWANRLFLGMPIQGSRLPPERIRWLGRLNMILAVALWAVFAAMCFGLLGPLQGIRTIGGAQ